MVQFLWFLFFTILGEVLRPKPKDAPTASLGDIQFPTAEDGRAIPLAFGTVLVGGANVVWYGDFLKDSIRVKSGLFGGSQVVGAQYYLGFQAALCGPVDAVTGLRWDDKEVTYTETDMGDHVRLSIDEPFLFGGKDSEGGIVGDLDFYLGTDTQTANDYLQSQLGASVPAYRGVTYAVGRQMYLGTTKYIKPPAWEVVHQPNGLGLTGGKHIIGRGANPGCILYYLATDADFGMGLSASLLDASTFTALAETCFDEGLGLNLLFDNFSVGGELFEDVLRHVDGVWYTDPVSGLLCVALIRDDYVLEDLVTIGEEEIVSVEVEEPSWGQLVNYTTVEYIDANYRKKSVPYPNLAAIVRRGEIESRTVQYHGFDSEAAALQVAARLSKRSAYPLKSTRMVLNRVAWNFRPGLPFIWTGAPYSVEARVMRVVDIGEGALEDGTMELQAVEDIFSVDSLAYQSATSDFTDPARTAEELTLAFLWEAPYHLNGGSEDIQVMVVSPRSNASIIGAEIHVDRAGGVAYTQTGDLEVFAAYGLLTADYDPGMGIDAAGFTVDGGVDLSLLESITETEFQRGAQLALIGEELFAFRDVTNNGDGTFTMSRVIRGVLDTVPRPHLENDEVFILNGTTFFDDDALPADGTVTAKLRPYTDRSILLLTDVSQLSIATDSRSGRAYPPGNVKVNGDVDPTEVVGDAVITWSHRNRATQYAADEIVQQNVSSGYSAEGDYLIEIWIEGAIRRSATTTGTTYTYTEAFRTADYGADLWAEVEVRIYGRNADLTTTSAYYQRLQFVMFAPS